ncbi:MAG: histidinol-phosphate transaminase [Lachnospiraceae bacterium]|nr:histidinol-phosphate transaminase [Lachnospiraceae bacterium]
MSFLWEDNVRKVVPYTPGEQPKEKGIIKLNTNENPYPPAPGVRDVLENFDADSLRLYPDPSISDLRKAIGEAYGRREDEVFVGVGSDDVLSMAFLTFFNSELPVIFPDVTYSFYDVWANVYGIKFECIPLRDDFSIRPSDYFRENGGVVIANPNAPTGMLLPLSDIEEIISHNRSSVVIVDEAYVDFGGESAVSLIDKYDNLLVVGTFSKSRSLAGSRIGFAFGNKELISFLNDVKYSVNSYTLDRLSIMVGIASIEDGDYFKECTDKICKTREKTVYELKRLGFSVLPSATNFVFARHGFTPAKFIFEHLKEKGIYVRHFSGPRIYNYLRITIGTDEEMDRLIEELTEYLERERAWNL